MCGFDGALGRNPVGLEAAHVRWHSQDGPDVVANGLALCALHHALFDLGVLGLTAELYIRVSSLYVARSHAGRRAVDDLSGQPLLAPRPGQPVVELGACRLASPAGLQGGRRPGRIGAGSGSDANRIWLTLDGTSDSYSALLLTIQSGEARPAKRLVGLGSRIRVMRIRARWGQGRVTGCDCRWVRLVQWSWRC